jgi:hypothetical protein
MHVPDMCALVLTKSYLATCTGRQRQSQLVFTRSARVGTFQCESVCALACSNAALMQSCRVDIAADLPACNSRTSSSPSIQNLRCRVDMAADSTCAQVRDIILALHTNFAQALACMLGEQKAHVGVLPRGWTHQELFTFQVCVKQVSSRCLVAAAGNTNLSCKALILFELAWKVMTQQRHSVHAIVPLAGMPEAATAAPLAESGELAAFLEAYRKEIFLQLLRCGCRTRARRRFRRWMSMFHEQPRAW